MNKNNLQILLSTLFTFSFFVIFEIEKSSKTSSFFLTKTDTHGKNNLEHSVYFVVVLVVHIIPTS